MEPTLHESNDLVFLAVPESVWRAASAWVRWGLTTAHPLRWDTGHVPS